ncbi:MAG TPA: hypothetical protein VLA96_13460 [Terriglobales bacterium]|jgi:hypothetical protein|nr:hypothetical protein [Terriglobales bacterium]
MIERLVRFRDGLSETTRWALLAVFTGIAIVATALAPRIPQPQGYHGFADERALLGIPYALNVLSNVPFLLVGACGLWWMWGSASPTSERFRDRRERVPAAVLFAGLVTTAFGSAYYHLDPNNQTLVFDRLGMIPGFMAILPLAVAERVSAKWGARLTAPMLALGVASVLLWDWSERVGAGDLRFYGFLQGYAFVATAGVLLFTKPRYDRQMGWVYAIGCYGLAKVLELFDVGCYAATGHAVSGHSLKHVAAALGGWFVLRMMQKRRVSETAFASAVR